MAHKCGPLGTQDCGDSGGGGSGGSSGGGGGGGGGGGLIPQDPGSGGPLLPTEPSDPNIVPEPDPDPGGPPPGTPGGGPPTGGGSNYDPDSGGVNSQDDGDSGRAARLLDGSTGDSDGSDDSGGSDTSPAAEQRGGGSNSDVWEYTGLPDFGSGSDTSDSEMSLDDFSVGNVAERFGVETQDDPDKMDLNDFTLGNLSSRFDPNDSAQQGDGSEPFDSDDFEASNIPENTADAFGEDSPLMALAELSEFLINNSEYVVYAVVALGALYVSGPALTLASNATGGNT